MKESEVYLLDTTAFIKTFTNENDCKKLRGFYDSKASLYVTRLSYIEGLEILKSKLDKEEYLEVSDEIDGEVRNPKLSIDEINITEPMILDECEKLTQKYSIDLADALLLIVAKEFSKLKIKTIIITINELLSKGAQNEGLNTWNYLDDPIM